MTRGALFGITGDGREVHRFVLQNASGMHVEILDYGGTVRACLVPDKTGSMRDVVLGYDTVEAYEKGTCYFGALIGRCANRIAGGRLPINGRTYALCCNDGANHLHGGKNGFNRHIWKARQATDSTLILYDESPDGDEGYPGNLSVKVIYSLSDDCALSIDYHAVCDRDSVCNLTNHMYFNLAGHDSGEITSEKVRIDAEHFMENDAASIPTGVVAPVGGTPMDFRVPIAVGAHIDDDFIQLRQAGGYDHNWIVRGYDGSLREMAYAYDFSSGVTLTMFTTLPGVQFYAGNFIPPGKGKGGACYGRRSAFCLESQYFPNLLQIEPYPQPFLPKGREYRQTTTYRFGLL